MRALGLPGQKRCVQQAAARPAPHLLDGICTFVQRVTWVTDAREGPPGPIGRVFRNDFSLAMRFGVLAGHDVKAVRAHDAAVFRACGGHNTTPPRKRFKRLLLGEDGERRAQCNPSMSREGLQSGGGG